MDIESVSKNKNEIVYHSLLEEIRNGLLPAGTRLPSERELADQYACSRITVRSALEKLGKKQVIRRIQGNGTFVNGIDTIASNDFRVGLILDAEEDELYNDPWLSELLYGMISAGRKQPFTISVIPVAGKEDIVISLRNRGQSLHDYNGFIAARNLSEDEIEILSTVGLPFVLLQNEIQKHIHSYVAIDNAKGAYLAACHLLAIGCRHVFFMLPKDSPQYSDRIRGFQKALLEFGRPAALENFILPVTKDDCADAERIINRMLARKTAFDGLLLGTDGCAYSVVMALRKHSLRVPEDISVILWDDFPWVSKALRLPLTVVRQPFREQIVSAIDILLSQRRMPRHSAIQRIIQPSLLVRCSTRTRTVAEGY